MWLSKLILNKEETFSRDVCLDAINFPWTAKEITSLKGKIGFKYKISTSQTNVFFLRLSVLCDSQNTF